MTCRQLDTLVRQWGFTMPPGAQRCDGLVREDPGMAMPGLLYTAPARRYLCVYGHSVLLPLQPMRPLTSRDCSRCRQPYSISSLRCAHELEEPRALSCRRCGQKIPSRCPTCRVRPCPQCHAKDGHRRGCRHDRRTEEVFA